MPLYEYRCKGCDDRFEVLQRVGQDASGVVCPRCGRAEAEKQHSTFAGASSGRVAGGGGCSPSGRFT